MYIIARRKLTRYNRGKGRQDENEAALIEQYTRKKGVRKGYEGLIAERLRIIMALEKRKKQ